MSESTTWRLLGATGIILILACGGANLAPAADPPAAVNQTEKFDPLFARWKKALGDLRELQARYREAKESDRGAVEEQYKKQLAEARSLAPQLLAAAERDFLAAPAQNRSAGEFLLSSAADEMIGDNFEQAFRHAAMLADNGFQDNVLYGLAATAAFNANEFAAAQKYLKLAKDTGLEQPQTQEIAQRLPKAAKDWEKEQAIRRAEAEADDLPRVKFVTTKGEVVLELFENEAPNSTANFISLVERKFYDGLKFHRVIAGFMAQGGDPKGDGTGGPGYSIPCECYRDDYRRHFRGSLSMAHAGRDTGGSQFFLTFVPTYHLDGKHTCFGRVIEGLDVLAKITRTEPARGGEIDSIVTATVLRKRNHPYEPQKGPER